MRTPFKIALIAGLALIGTQASGAAARQQQPAQAAMLGREDGAKVMRALLTIQANRPYGPRMGYGTLAQILESVPTIQDETTRIDDQTATYRGYTIRMTRSTDHARFELTMIPTGGTCAVSWFSNEQNVIYAGLALGCPVQ